MEKINIAELLKKCPTGMELDCLIYDNVYFKCIREHAIYPIVCYTIDSKGEKEEITFTWYGKYALTDTAKCVIFPKGKTTWEGFVPPCTFKVGDIVRSRNYPAAGNFVIVGVKEDGYSINIKNYYIKFTEQDNWELVPDKFNITALRPFDKVLVRNSNISRWGITFYELYDDKNMPYPHRTLGGTLYKQCIPYKGNEHLVGLVKNCEAFYRTWE